ncbi:YicC family protein [Leeia sp. TBRC 13508]|uniref:YicC family protein n=1 Tax=Leeia speluncae TaxID=2884804 RepID=A0ABS8D592_9NEIS|nr:YicC/YloC family endoribonuclease [Leeia speluncae]MCB6183297.1 YicC family protein [Leeia speluncae]
MIASMTGYAVKTLPTPIGMMTLELKSVNHRFLDAVFRQPEEFRQFEPLMRESLSARLNRGKLECRIGLVPNPDQTPTLQVNQATVSALLAAEQQVLALAGGAKGLTVSDILRWPGVLATDSVDTETLAGIVKGAIEAVLDDFIATRHREGDKLSAMLIDRIEQIEAIVKDITPLLPAVVAAYQQKLTERLQEVLEQGEESRIQQEVALFAQKIDVDEELTRLTTHCTEVRRILKKGGVVGKRLDFLMQELHREANTLGSKAANMEFTQASMDLKVLIEQMREQVQNIE